jgi:hypothetical protein
MDAAYHYPPELLELLVQTIPRLCPSKPSVLDFFRGAGVQQAVLRDLAQQVATDRSKITKFAIVRTVLTRLNERGDATLRERREVIKRVVEFEDFSTCWPEDQLKAKGLVAEIRRVVQVKDAFSRINIERQKEADARKAEAAARAEERLKRDEAIEKALRDLRTAVTEADPQQRGKLLESAINSIFAAYRILVRESFRRVADKAPHAIEQIDGVIVLDGELYFVEVKWLSGRVSVDDVSRHLVRIYHRGYARGLFVSVAEFSAGAEDICREALQKTVVALALLEEIVTVLEERQDLTKFLRAKVHAAQIDKKPFVRVRPRAGSATGAV